jgi:Dolichyl-phosphate-mannose-protein mannosyltransferase
MTPMTRSVGWEIAKKWGLVAVVLAAALAIRLHEIDQPLVTFRAIRHYRSAIIARDFYYHATSGIAPQMLLVADANRAIQQAGEPPLMELLACLTYLVLGHENTAWPRAYAATAWVLGAIPLYFLGLRVGSRRASLIACALFLFLPYGIIASRNFQPDAVMTLASLCALLALIRYAEQPEPPRRAAAIALVGLALLIKPMSLFLTVPVLIGLHLARGKKPRLALGGLIITLALCFIPAGLYYGYAAIFGNFVKDQMQTRFVPNLMLTSFFWFGLLTQVRRVFTWPIFVIGLIGSVLAPSRLARVLMACLWIGYAAFAVAFTYHMPTHDYYHWPYIAVVALGVAALFARIEQTLAASLPARVMDALVLTTGLVIAVLGTRAAWPRLEVRGAADELARYREIGELAHHDTRVLFLDPEYGYPLMYHAEVAGDTWPNQDDVNAERLGGRPPIDANARFERDYEGFNPHYFVVTDLDSFDAQTDLQALLKERATLIHQVPHYRVYKFREPQSAAWGSQLMPR